MNKFTGLQNVVDSVLTEAKTTQSACGCGCQCGSNCQCSSVNRCSPTCTCGTASQAICLLYSRKRSRKRGPSEANRNLSRLLPSPDRVQGLSHLGDNLAAKTRISAFQMREPSTSGNYTIASGSAIAQKGFVMRSRGRERALAFGYRNFGQAAKLIARMLGS